MPALLVDYENVSGSNGLKGADALCEKDTLIIFYSNCCTRIRYDHMQDIIESGCKFRVIKLKGAGKNALDFYIAAECGVMSERGEDEIAIISNDKGFQAVIDFFAMDQETLNVRIVKAENIENALTLFTNPEDKQRRKLLIHRKTFLDLTTEYGKIEERNRISRELTQLLKGTMYEEKNTEILNLVFTRKSQGKKALYTGALHEFGRKDGTKIYQMIKDSMDSKH